jgi:hypothetical protein
MREMCTTPRCNTSGRCACAARAPLGRGRGAPKRCLAGAALLAAAACSDGVGVSSAVNENSPGGPPRAPAGAPPSDVPFLADAPGSAPPAPGDSESQEPEPNATETNFIVPICWQDSDCPGGTCQLYVPDGGARAAAPPAGEDAGASANGSDSGVLGPPRGRCVRR